MLLISFQLISDLSGFTQQDSGLIWNCVIGVSWVPAVSVNELKSEWSKLSVAASYGKLTSRKMGW